MPLFTPSESYALQNFFEHIEVGPPLDGVGHTPTEAEWAAMYNMPAEGPSGSSHPVTNGSSEQQSQAKQDVGNDSFEGEEVPQDNKSELTRAARNLMSLDTNPQKWSDSADRDIPRHMQHQQQHQRHSASPVHVLRQPRSSTPAHAARPSSSLSEQVYPSNSRQKPALAKFASGSRSGDGILSANDSLTSNSSVNSSDTSPPPATPPITKRPYDAIHDPSSSNAGASSSSYPYPPYPKKRRASPSHSHPQTISTTHTSIAHAGSSTSTIITTKPTLLSASQKKANHIQSEQKRRANIRRGYEALCDTVPALREAIQREDEEIAARLAAEQAQHGSGAGKVKKKVRAKKKVNETGEKVDGRAGPRSENIVLQKTIDYIHDILDEKSALLDRLTRARSALARNGQPPPASINSSDSNGIPLWEREWGGGTGILLDGDDGGDSDEGED